MEGNDSNKLLSNADLSAALTTIASPETSALLRSNFLRGPIMEAASPARQESSISSALISDPILLANAIALERQRALAARYMLTDAYQRGREEALLSLVRSGSLMALSSQLQPASAPVTSSTVPDIATSAVPEEKKVNEKALETLGSASIERRKTNAPYFDASSLSDPDPVPVSQRARGGVVEHFPAKLHRMLCEVEEEGETNIVSFFPHGRAFSVHNPVRFVSEVMPKYFKQSRLSSFQRQLNLYGFTRITSGPDAGGYYHELFLKGRPALVGHIRRVGVPQGSLKSSSFKPGSSAPDFYSMRAIQKDEDSKCSAG